MSKIDPESEAESLSVEQLDYITDTLHAAGLSNRSILYVHATVRKMYNFAVKRGYAAFNPYARYDLPRIRKYTYRILPEDEMRRMLQLVKGTDLEVPVTMALCYGLRRGECLGIMPSFDLDNGNCVLHVQRSRSVEERKMVITPCKTEDSDRYVLLRPEHYFMLAKALSRDSFHVFACDLTPMQLEHRFKRFLDRYDFPRIRFHDLRHSFATLMMQKGVNPKIVSAVLGHSDVSVTLEIYSHPNVQMQRACLDAFK